MATLNEGYITIGRAALLLDLSTETITRWYKWWENDNFKHPEDMFLPNYYYKDRRKSKYFKVEDVEHLKTFHEQLMSTHSGTMAEFNAAYQWGKRGDKLLKNKKTTSKEVKAKFI